MGLCVVLGGPFMAQAQEVSSGGVEVVIQGKQYESVRAYKREQIKEVLLRALSSKNLKEFSEDELCGIIKEARKQQTAGSSSKETLESPSQRPDKSLQGQQAVEEDATGFSPRQMQEMLEGYLKEHKDAKPLFVDPDKVKSIIIEP